MTFMGIRLVGLSAETGQKVLLTVAFVLGILVLRAGVVALAGVITGKERNERVMFWTRQGASVLAAMLSIVALLSIWFDDPARLTTGLGLFGAGLAFALQRVVTALAGYLVIMRGNTFTVGDRITMGGVRGDVIALTFMQTKIMEMGQPPAVQGADPAVWVRARQFTGRIVTVTNDKVFNEPVYNYTREFPFIWEEITLPISYKADRTAPRPFCLSRSATRWTRSTATASRCVAPSSARYFISVDDLTPRVFYRLTDNWLELTVRFIVREHGIREIKDEIARVMLRKLEEAAIDVASATYEIVGVPPLRVQNVTSR